MKKNIFLLPLVIGMITFGCGEIREKSAEELLKGEKMRNEIFDEIFSKREYTEKIFDKMQTDSLGKEVMFTNPKFIKMTCNPERIDSMMNVDGEMMENMANILVNKMEADTATCTMMCSKVMASERLKIFVTEHVCKTKGKK